MFYAYQMKILMLTPYLPYPPSSGGQVRSYNLIKNLAKLHEITLFSLIKGNEEKKYTKELKKYCKEVRIFNRPARPWTLKNILLTGFSLHPFLVIRNLSDEEKEALKVELRTNNYDLIHAENFYVMPHLPKTNTPVLLTEQTILYRVYQHYVESLPNYLFWLKPLLNIDVWKLKREESYYWKSADFLSAVSQEDKDHISSLVPGKKIRIVDNGVDCEYYEKRKYPKNQKPTILFGAADFHWMQNKEGAKILLDQIWPEIKKRMPESQLWIVGKIAPQALKEYNKIRDITIQEISDSREAYQRSWVLLAPMRSGGGSRTKFFEAMASGLPIVTTPEGMEGIPAQNNEEAIIDNNLNHLVEMTIEILKNKKFAQKISDNGKNFVKNSYDWSNSAEKLNKLYQEIKNVKN